MVFFVGARSCSYLFGGGVLLLEIEEEMGGLKVDTMMYAVCYLVRYQWK